MVKKKGTGAHYVDNKHLYAVMIEFKKSVDEAEQSGDTKPQIPDYVGRCLLQIANRLATKPNFANYTFKDDMISDGIENCLQYLDNFNPKKTNNPFAYFTQIIYYAFVRRIQKEKKQTTIKHRMIQNANYDDMTLQPGEDRDFKNQFTEFLRKNIPAEEPVKKTTPKKKKKLVKKKK